MCWIATGVDGEIAGVDAVRIGEAPSDAVPGRLLPLYELRLIPRGPS